MENDDGHQVVNPFATRSTRTKVLITKNVVLNRAGRMRARREESRAAADDGKCPADPLFPCGRGHCLLLGGPAFIASSSYSGAVRGLARSSAPPPRSLSRSRSEQ